ncbi:MAG TPA: LuxR C-terminal-related transcriptional regulator [Verrucomicrobiae bacterium]
MSATQISKTKFSMQIIKFAYPHFGGCDYAVDGITPREVRVLNELAKGLANKEIARVLNITENTAKDHLKSILGKLRVGDRTEAVTAAIQRGIIHL